VGEDGADDFFGVTLLAKNLGACGGVLLVRGVGLVGPALVVEIVEQSGDTPELFIGAMLAGVGADAGFHRQHVLAETLRLRVFAQELPGLFACGHGLEFPPESDSLPYADRGFTTEGTESTKKVERSPRRPGIGSVPSKSIEFRGI
jgi:hypothetical protein